MLASRPWTHALKPPGHWAKNWDAKISQGHFMAKILFLHQISCRVNQRTQLSCNRKLGDELCLAGKELSKTQQCFHHFPKSQFKRDFGHSVLFTPSCSASQTAFDALAAACDFGPLRFSRKRRTWRWRAREKAAGSGQCGKRPRR